MTLFLFPIVRGLSHPKFAMRTDPHEVKKTVVRFSVNQNKIGFDVAIPVIRPLTRKRVVKVSPWQRLVNNKKVHDSHEGSIKFFPMLP